MLGCQHPLVHQLGKAIPKLVCQSKAWGQFKWWDGVYMIVIICMKFDTKTTTEQITIWQTIERWRKTVERENGRSNDGCIIWILDMKIIQRFWFDRERCQHRGRGVAMTPLLTLAAKDSPFIKREMAYLCLLNGFQMKAANGSGLGDGGVQNNTGLTRDWVLSWTPTMMDAVPIIESTKSGNKHFIVDITQPEDFNCDTNSEMLQPSWSRWTNATNSFNLHIDQSWSTIDAWIAKYTDVGSLVL